MLQNADDLFTNYVYDYSRVSSITDTFTQQGYLIDSYYFYRFDILTTAGT
jgi:hypothetical protein